MTAQNVLRLADQCCGQASGDDDPANSNGCSHRSLVLRAGSIFHPQHVCRSKNPSRKVHCRGAGISSRRKRVHLMQPASLRVRKPQKKVLNQWQLAGWVCRSLSILRSSAVSDPFQVRIIRRGIGVPDNLTVGNGLAGSGIDPFVGFGMTIGEAKDAGKIVQTRWIVEKDVLEHIYSESRAANVGRIDIRKNESISRLVRRKL